MKVTDRYRFYQKLNYNCPESEKSGSGPGSCGGGQKEKSSGSINKLTPKIKTRESYLGIKDSNNFDINTERKIISSVHESNAKFWNGDSKEIKYLLARDGITETNMPETIDTGIIFDNQDEYFGRGVAGYGGAKVWWNPYTLKDRFAQISESVQEDGGLDPIMTLSHELHHAYGHDNELDLMSKAAGLNAHLDLKMQYASKGIENMLLDIIMGMFSTYKSKQEHRDNAMIFRTLINNDENTLKQYLHEHKLVNDEKEYDYMRYSDVKAKAMSFRTTTPKHRDMSDDASIIWETARKQNSLSEVAEFMKLNYNCPDSEKSGSGPGSCSGSSGTSESDSGKIDRSTTIVKNKFEKIQKIADPDTRFRELRAVENKLLSQYEL